MNRAVIPVMRAQRSGRIVNLSSVAGAIPIPFQAFYSANKAAINLYTMALANEIKPFGVQVCCVQPGDIRPAFTAARQKIVVGDDIYGGRISRSVAGMEKRRADRHEARGRGRVRVRQRERASDRSTPSGFRTNSSRAAEVAAREDAQPARRHGLCQIIRKPGAGEIARPFCAE